MLFIYFAITLLACYYYNSRQYVKFIIASFAICSDGFGILSPPDPLKTVDLFSVIILYGFVRGTLSINCKGDRIGKILLWLLLYEFIIGAATILTRHETPVYSVMVLRFEIYYFIYFLFKKIPNTAIEKAFKYLYIITVVTGLLYYLQFVGVVGILQISSVENVSSYTFYDRVQNKPLLTSIMLFYSLFYKGKLKYRWLSVFFFLGMIVLSQNRSEIIAVLASIGIAFIVVNDRKLWNKYVVLIVVSILTFMPIMSYRFSSEGSVGTGAFTEMQSSFDIISRNKTEGYGSGNDVINTEGTLVYRMLVLKERLDYLSESFLRTIFGIGTVHEYSPSGRSLAFFYGNIDTNKDVVYYIDTTDIAFLSHVIRYGLVYLGLFVYFVCLASVMLKKCKDEIFSLCALLLLISYLLRCFTGDFFTGVDNMFFLFLILSQIHKFSIRYENTEKNIPMA